MWEVAGSILQQYGLAALVCLAALGGMGYALRALWLRNKELASRNETLSDKLAKTGKISNEEDLKARHEEVVTLLKMIRFVHSGDGEVMKKLNEILDIERQMYEAHLGPSDPEGRLKWWGAARVEELLLEVTSYEERIAALQEQRLKEAKSAGHRIDELQEKRVSEAHVMVRESMTILQENQKSSERIREAMEDLRAVVRRE